MDHDNNVRKRSWSKQDKAPQMVAKPRLTPRKVILCDGIGKELFTMRAAAQSND